MENAHIEFWQAGPGAGYFVEWYRDDDNNSGYGDNARVVRWYGSQHECHERIKHAPPKSGWQPI